ncbi:hypothetical protein CEXT_210541 [Caerostris extrusa]|uniref:Uncharacterized protein n=1 Tax=Caerostris extrusa TaxID=172846 RepID=A0AAV4UPP9_CAEEX|nr:hypothetical protein CEXT_210541 [Caerostris extrusa]
MMNRFRAQLWWPRCDQIILADWLRKTVSGDHAAKACAWRNRGKWHLKEGECPYIFVGRFIAASVTECSGGNRNEPVVKRMSTAFITHRRKGTQIRDQTQYAEAMAPECLKPHCASWEWWPMLFAQYSLYADLFSASATGHWCRQPVLALGYRRLRSSLVTIVT